MPEQCGFDPLTLPESNATSYPEPFRAAVPANEFVRMI